MRITRRQLRRIIKEEMKRTRSSRRRRSNRRRLRENSSIARELSAEGYTGDEEGWVMVPNEYWGLANEMGLDARRLRGPEMEVRGPIRDLLELGVQVHRDAGGPSVNVADVLDTIEVS